MTSIPVRIVSFCHRILRGSLILAVFISALGFGGIHPPVLFAMRLVMTLAFLTQPVLSLFERNYPDDFKNLKLPFLFFVGFVLLVLVQWGAGLNLLTGSKIGTLQRFATYDSLIQLAFYFVFFMVAMKAAGPSGGAEKFFSALAPLVFIVTVLELLRHMLGTDKTYGFWSSGAPRGDPGQFFGTFINENHFGGFLGLTLPSLLALAWIRFEKIRAERRFSPASLSRLALTAKYLNSGVFLFIFLIVLALAVCFFVGAKASAVVNFFGLFLFIPALARKRQPQRFLPLIVILLSLFFVLVFVLGRDKLRQDFAAATLIPAFLERLSVVQDSFKIFQDYPLFGTGLGTYYSISPRYVSADIDRVVWKHAHNDFLELLTDTGFFGCGLFFLGLATLVYAGRMKKPDTAGGSRFIVRIQAGVALVTIGFMELFDYHLKTPAVALLFISQLALLSGGFSPRSGIEKPLSPVPKGALFLICIVSGIFLLCHAVNDYRVWRLGQRSEGRLEGLRSAVKLQPENAALWFQTAQEHKKMSAQTPAGDHRNHEEALRAMRTATMLSPTFAPYWFALGDLAYSSGNHFEGRLAFEKAVYWSPQKAGYLLHLMAVYLRELKTAPKDFAETMDYKNRVRELYLRLKGLKRFPKAAEQVYWMGSEYYQELQAQIPQK